MLHAATKVSALDVAGREALLRYVLRPPPAQERLERQPDGLVRITLKRAYNDGTIAVDMDPLSLLSRLAMSVPPLRCAAVRGVLFFVGLGALGMILGLSLPRPVASPRARWIAIVGAVAFAFQTAVVNAIAWPAYFRG